MITSIDETIDPVDKMEEIASSSDDSMEELRFDDNEEEYEDKLAKDNENLATEECSDKHKVNMLQSEYGRLDIKMNLLKDTRIEDDVFCKRRNSCADDKEEHENIELLQNNILPENHTTKGSQIESSETSKNNTKTNKISDLIDSESEVEPLDASENEKTSKHKFSSLIDSDSEKSDIENQINFSATPVQEHKDHEKFNRPVKSRKIRGAAQKAIDAMQAIQSEQQRLHREAYISVPYHKPKKHTFQEFLKRKTITKPYLKDNTSAIPNRNLKMTQEELEEYAKLMEERAKEAVEFFKSESDEDNTNSNESTNYDAETNVEKESIEVVNDVAETNVEKESIEVVNDVEAMNDHLSSNEAVKEATPKLVAKSFAHNLKQIINEKNLPESPSIKGDSNMIIDFETGDIISRKPTGVETLLQRFISSSVCRKTSNPTESISTENGTIEISKVNINKSDDSKTIKEQAPGHAYLKLKENLRKLIAQKRNEAREQKKSITIGDQSKCDDDTSISEKYDNNLQTCDVNTNLEKVDKQINIIIDEEENAIELTEEDENEDDSDIEEMENNIPRKKNEFGQNESSDASDKENEDDHGSEADDEYEGPITLSSRRENKRNKRIVQAFQDDSDCEDASSGMLPPTSTTPSTCILPNVTTLFDREPKGNPIDDENEILELCSGRFSGNAPMTQIHETQNNDSTCIENEELCSVSSNTEKAQSGDYLSTDQKNNKILSSDEEKTANSPEKKVKHKKKNFREKKSKLGFSDDENDQSSCYSSDSNELPQTFVEYDSEENEIEVQLTKEDCVKRAENFLENEAELSESDWGSADENEENTNQYDIELGDEEDFDQRKLQAELGKIHLRKVLDDDIREVKKIQELFFEDEELDGKGRERQFKWKNIESGFSLDNDNNIANDGTSFHFEDDENEHLWRKMRHERELLLVEKKLDDTSLILNSSAGDSKLTFNKKLNIVTSKVSATSNGLKTGSPFLISKTTSLNRKSTRGSFLVRDKDTLQKLASLAKADGTATFIGSTQVKSVKPQNFIFQTLTEEEHTKLKRKTGLDSSCNFVKKQKLDLKHQNCLIDQLL